MAIIYKESKNMNVVEAARIRIKNIFKKDIPIYLSVSGEKDSICLMDVTYKLILEKEIDPKKLRCVFLDEEAIFDETERIVRDWRKKFLNVGVPFDWYCIPIRHYNCLNSLQSDESFITWDKYKKDVWVRPMPEFAITHHPQLREYKDRYQVFFNRILKDGLTMLGVRVAESLQRRKNLAAISSNAKNNAQVTNDNKVFPIYDWKDKDIWLYILNNKLDYPEAYIYMYQTGVASNRLRISEFFAVDTARILSKLGEFYPGLMEKVIDREPNAYLVALYWDTEMFKRSSSKRREMEKDNKRDYRELALSKIKEIQQDKEDTYHSELLKLLARKTKAMILKYYDFGINNNQWKKIYEMLLTGDPKQRTLRAIIQDITEEKVRDHKKILEQERIKNE